MIDHNSDGLTQIAHYLDGRTGVGAIHILSHGGDGELHLGNAAITTATLAGHASDLAAIKAALTGSADILLYGCDVAAGPSGQDFIDALSAATGADVAASIDDTGAAALGGDWVLESQSGSIDAESIDAASYDDLLWSAAQDSFAFYADTNVPPGAPANNNQASVLGTQFSAVGDFLGGSGLTVTTAAKFTATNIAALTAAEAITNNEYISTTVTVASTNSVALGAFRFGALGTAQAASMGALYIRDVATNTLTRVSNDFSANASASVPITTTLALNAGSQYEIRLYLFGSTTSRQIDNPVFSFQNNEAPINAVPAAKTAFEDTTLAFTGLSITDVEGGTITTTVSVTHGTLAPAAGAMITGSGTASVTLSGTVAQINTSLAGLNYAPAVGYLGADTLTITSTDGNSLSDTDTVAITVANVNDAPAGADKTVTTLEDTAYTLTVADFGFTDPNDSPANSLQAVRIFSLPGFGTLTHNGVAVTAGTTVTVADVNSGLLKWTPPANMNGTFASFAFQVQDDGGTANGGSNLDNSTNTITFNVTAVNDAPAGANGSASINDNQTKTFAAADFSFTDPNDSPANGLANIIIRSLPASGTLKLAGVDVSINDAIPVASLSSLVFTPVTGSNTQTFTFQVQDNGGTANSGADTDPTVRTFTITVSDATPRRRSHRQQPLLRIRTAR